VIRADAEHINIICHGFGDLSVHQLLDAIALARKKNPEWDRRPVTSHAILVQPMGPACRK